MNDGELRFMANCIYKHLSRDESLEVGRIAFKEPERLAAYLATRAGESMSEADFAAFVLQCARRIAAGPAA